MKRKKVIEYQVSEVNEYGDLIDCDFYDTKAEALDQAKRLIEWGVEAVTVERTERLVDGFGDFDNITYTDVADFGKAAEYIANPKMDV